MQVYLLFSMVCSPGDGGKMGVMARLLASQTVAGI